MLALENLLSQQLIERLGWTLIHFVWQATAVALLLATVLRLLSRRSAEVRYVVSCLALSLIVALPLLTLPLVEVSGPAAQVGPAATLPPVVDATPLELIDVAELPTESLDERPLPVAAPAAPTPWTQRAAAALEPTLPYLVVGWLLGVFGLSAWHLGGWAQLHRMKRRMIHETAPSLRAQLATLSERLGIWRTVGLLESALVEVPTVVGWIKPVILLSASALTGLSAEQLEAILAHELAHVRRHDYLVNIAQTLVEILGFHHPAVWWVSHRIRDERENCCDDLAVQVCGDSVRYARALTRLEEMRHRGTELAVAASGGSLVVRVGRLLGRPTTNNRRFTWLPGLIALLLVALIIIPAALVLATPDRGKPGLFAQQENERATKDPTRILLDIRTVFVFDDRPLGRDVAASLRSTLGANSTVGNPDTWHSTAPNDLFRRIAKSVSPAETVLALAETLYQNKCLELICRSQVQAHDGRRTELAVLVEESSNSPPFEEFDVIEAEIWEVHEGAMLALKATVTDNDNVLLQINLEQSNGEYNPSQSAQRKTIDHLVALSSDECFAMHVAPSVPAQLPGSLYVMVTPTIVRTNRDAAADEYSEQAHPKVVVGTKAQALDGAEQQDGEQVLIDFILAKALASATLDHETALLIGNALAAEYPKATGEISDAASSKDVTLGEILQKYVTQRPLRAATVDTLVNLFQSRGYVEIHARPSVLTRDNTQAQIKAGSTVPILPPGSPASAAEYVDLGTAVQVTPHLSPSASDRITLEVGVKWTEWAKQTETDSNPAVQTTEVESTVTTLRDRYFSLLVEPDNTANATDTDSELMLIMFRADCVEPQVRPAQAQQSNGRPRQVLLDVRTVAAEPSDLAALGVEWGSPPPSAPSLSGDSSGLNIGYTPDRDITDSLLTRLDRLCEQSRAQLISRQRVVALDGKQARVRAVTEEWFALHAPATARQSEPPVELVRIASGTVLSATPRIGEDNQIRLELTTEYSRGIPSEQGGELPVVTRRTTRNVVTLKDGGSAALAGLAYSEREILILVTARVVPENGQLPQPAETAPVPRPASNGSHAAPVRVRTEATNEDAASEDEETRIVMDLAVLSVPDDRALSPETAARLSSLWDQMCATRETGRDGRASFPSVEELQVTPRQLLERRTENAQGDSDALEIMIDLLISLEYVKVVLNPRVEVINGEQAVIMSKQHVPDPTAGPEASEMVECSDVLKITPDADSAGRITLDVAAEITNLAPSKSTSETPLISKHSIDTKAILDKGKTLVLRLGPTTEITSQDDPVLYLLVRPRIAPPKPAPSDYRDTMQEAWPAGIHAASTMFAAADDEGDAETYYARILFEDGNPAVIKPTPWPGAHTRIGMLWNNRGRVAGRVDNNGWLTLQLSEAQIRALTSDRTQLKVETPRQVEKRWQEAGDIPFDELSTDEAEPATITVRRPTPPPALPPDQLAGYALPKDWRLKYTGRNSAWPATGEAVVLGMALSSPFPDNESHELNLYLPDGTAIKPMRLRKRDVSILLRKADTYVAIHRRRIRNTDNTSMETRTGPFRLDLGRPGRYELRLPAKAGQAEIAGSLEDAFAVTFQRVGRGALVNGYAHPDPARRYAIDDLPPGTYRLSAVTQRADDNVFVRRAEVTIGDSARMIANLRSPDVGMGKLNGAIRGQHAQPRYGDSEGPQWYVLIRPAGSGPVTTADAYGAMTMDALYVVRGKSIVQETHNLARFSIEGIAPGTYTVTATERNPRPGVVIRRQQSRLLTIGDGDELSVDFNLGKRDNSTVAPATGART